MRKLPFEITGEEAHNVSCECSGTTEILSLLCFNNLSSVHTDFEDHPFIYKSSLLQICKYWCGQQFGPFNNFHFSDRICEESNDQSPIAFDFFNSSNRYLK